MTIDIAPLYYQERFSESPPALVKRVLPEHHHTPSIPEAEAAPNSENLRKLPADIRKLGE